MGLASDAIGVFTRVYHATGEVSMCSSAGKPIEQSSTLTSMGKHYTRCTVGCLVADCPASVLSCWTDKFDVFD